MINELYNKKKKSPTARLFVSYKGVRSVSAASLLEDIQASDSDVVVCMSYNMKVICDR